MSFLKSLFGLGGKASEAPAGPLKSIEHNGFTIHATPYQEGGQHQLCGVVEKEIDGELRQHRFVRADRFPGAEEAADFALVKGKQLVDEQGDALFK
ncbi:HlyU family transcriptional regulator [Bosea sp. LjRoot9]|uniref:HlyU family transcriptional regulator n=1 Tax=Bosea sp. LjRoot9 TaxID=3342341 RepID=UPI003ED09007